MHLRIIDDVIPKLYQDRIEAMMTNVGFPWAFLPDVTYRKEDEAKSIDPNAQGSAGFAHLFYDRMNEHESPYWDFCFPLFLSFLNDPTFELMRVKGGLLLPTKMGYNMPHVDAECPHTTALYYVNDSDGDTYFFSGDGEVHQTVTPKKGRMVEFDGLTMHASHCPVESNHRVVINFNYVTQTQRENLRN